jgi:ribose transport system substrate-binding protein
MIFVGKMDAENAQALQESEKPGRSNVEIIDVRTDDTDTVRAKANAADTLVKHPDTPLWLGLELQRPAI